MDLESKIRWLFRVNAFINWSLSLRGLLDPVGMAVLLGGPMPNYPFLIRLWSGLIFMFGCLFWDASTDLEKRSALVKYNWLEKLITASAVSIGYCQGDVPPRLMALVVLTNWIWIPWLLVYDLQFRRAVQR
jgi:hypothetical protein